MNSLQSPRNASARAPWLACSDALDWGLFDEPSAHAMVECMRATYLKTCSALHGPKAQWLRTQITQASGPHELWMLRGAIVGELAGAGASAAALYERSISPT